MISVSDERKYLFSYRVHHSFNQKDICQTLVKPFKMGSYGERERRQNHQITLIFLDEY